MKNWHEWRPRHRFHVEPFARTGLSISWALAGLLIVQFLLSVALTSSARAATDFPDISISHVSPSGASLASAIDRSGLGELTLASFNVRNLGSRERSAKDFETIVDLVDEADIVVFQEAGLGLFIDSTPLAIIDKRLRSVLSAFSIYFGPDWKIITADMPTGEDGGRETTILAYRERTSSYRLSVKWQEYVDLGPRRDMAVFRVKTSSGRGIWKFQLGSVHLKPEDPFRSAEMTRAVDWLVHQAPTPTIIAGDFNWGYRKEGKGEAHKGEKHVASLHARGTVFQPFADISYLARGGADEFRTNMGFTQAGKMYDQFLLSPGLAGRLADGGRFLEDIGIVAFDIGKGRMRDLIEKEERTMRRALEIFFKKSKLDGTRHKASVDRAKARFRTLAQGRATYRISDHRPIWIQLKVY